MKVSDYVAAYVAQLGTRHVFMVAGGGAMHLNDSFGHCSGLEVVCTLHEQAAAIAAEAYSKTAGELGTALVTTGPGGTNAVTGVAGAWLDSTPCLFISGQVKRADLRGASGVRQMGVQEVDIVSIVASITKYAVTIMDAESVRYHLDNAVHLARSGRPGPVWIDIPLDVQAAQIDPAAIAGMDMSDPTSATSSDQLGKLVSQSIDLINGAERPVLLIGNGLRLSGAEKTLSKLIEALGIPVLLTWPAQDMLDDSHVLLVGRPGPVAPRGANFALQNSDLVLSVGARLDLVLTGYSHENFARAAKKIMVDIDPAEIKKMKCPIDLPVCADAGSFVKEVLHQSDRILRRDHSGWIKRCREWKERYPVVLPEFRNQELVSTYVLADVLSDELSKDDILVSGSAGSGIEIFLLAYRAKAGQRVFLTTALGAMGYGPPASIGACLAGGRRRVICVDGDGGLQLNVQEFETIARLQLPIKYFVLSNSGYSSIRASQMRYFRRLAGADASSGLTLPSVGKVAASYGLPSVQIGDSFNLADKVRDVLKFPGPIICEVVVNPDEPRMPSLSSAQRPDGTMVSRPLEDLWPFLERSEFLSNMIIPPLPD